VRALTLRRKQHEKENTTRDAKITAADKNAKQASREAQQALNKSEAPREDSQKLHEISGQLIFVIPHDEHTPRLIHLQHSCWHSCRIHCDGCMKFC
jgi:hypothetical protein